MKSTNWKDIAELIGIAAIVASLVFVGLQMRQERIHARAELAGGSFESVSELRLQVTAPEFAVTFAKAVEQPAELTSAEKIQVNGYLEAFTLLVIRECYLVLQGVFGECRIIVREYGPLFFGNEYAQAWWRAQDVSGISFIPGWLDAEIRAIDPQFNQTQLRVLDR